VKDRIRHFSAIITVLLMVFQLTVGVMPMTVCAADADIIKAVTPASGATNVTNVGLEATGLIKIEFNQALNPATLDKDSVVITRGTTVIDYTPVVNDGLVYAIDPADLANNAANGGANRAEYTGVSWNDYANQSYTITLKTTAELEGGGSAVSEDLTVTSFSSLYFVDIPYEDGKYIDNVGASATISATATSGTNQAPQTLLTNPDVPYNSSGAYSILNPTRKLTDLGTITLDKAYDVTGVMIRTRYGASSGPSWNGVTFKVGDTRESATAMLYTGFGNPAASVNNTSVLGNFADGLSSAVNGQYVYLDMEAEQLFFPNKIWIFAYVDRPLPEVVDEDVIESIIPEDGATNVTNVGVDGTRLIKISFKKEMNPSTLNKDSIIIKRGTETVDYVPLLNDGFSYVIDPAALAPSGATGSASGGANTGAHWNDEFYGQTYTISIGGGARQIDGTKVTNTSLLVSSFTSDYFVNIPYADEKYIESVGGAASIEVKTTSATNKEPSTLLTNGDTPYSDNGAYVILNPDKNLTDLATITLDKKYDVAGVMVRTRANASSAPSWNGGVFAAGDEKASATVLLNTGTGIDNTRVLGGFVGGWENAVNTDKVYISITTNQLFFPNKVWVFAYLDAPEKFLRIYEGFVAEMDEVSEADFEAKWNEYAALLPEFFVAEIDNTAFDAFAAEFVMLRELTKSGKFGYDIGNADKEKASREYIKLIENAYLLGLLNDGDVALFESESEDKAIENLIAADVNAVKFAQMYSELKDNVTDNDSFCEVLMWSEKLSYLEDGTRDDIKNTLSKYGALLGVDLSYGEDKKVTLEKVAVKFDTNGVSKFYKCLDEEYKRIVDSIVKSNSSGGGTGGSTSVGGSGGGGGISYGANTSPAKPITPVQNQTVNTPVNVQTYSDMAGFSWAADAVEELTELNIINGDGEGNFNPQDNVKREEFVKMIVMALGLDTQKVEMMNAFADCTPEDWYYPYIMIARQNGIINGVSDFMFGSGQNILRQDAAVVISKNVSVSSSEADVVFADSAFISDYAVEAVAKMTKAQLIAGFENGEFRPQGNLTRAEAAVLISRMLEYIERSK